MTGHTGYTNRHVAANDRRTAHRPPDGSGAAVQVESFEADAAASTGATRSTAFHLT